jgi:uncharacterized linocin/CFP29 family protein
MTQNDPQVPWTDEQWARANQVIQEEANRARVAATFLPLDGPLPGDTDFVRRDRMSIISSVVHDELTIEDQDTIRLATLQINVSLRGAQMADPDMSSALQIFRRAANVIARLEDAIVFRGQSNRDAGPQAGTDGLPRIWQVRGGQHLRGLWKDDLPPCPGIIAQDESCWVNIANPKTDMVAGVSTAISVLEGKGHFGPFALVLGDDFFLQVQSPNSASLVLPQDRIIPFLGGGPLRRSSTLKPESGVIVALGGAPVELVVATDLSLCFLQVTTDPHFVFRLYEKIVLRIKQAGAIVTLATAKDHAGPANAALADAVQTAKSAADADQSAVDAAEAAKEAEEKAKNPQS